MSRPARPRRTFTQARADHRHASIELTGIDTELEALLARRRRCLGDLADARAQLCRRWGDRHIRRRPMVDEAPLPPPFAAAEPLWGADLRAVCLRLLRRHGPQRLRDLHGLLHCYGFVIDSGRPVQRLADALGYECAHGRAQRLRRGVYEAVGDGRLPFPAPLPPDPDELPWRQPQTDGDPPLVDQAVALDPEHWSADAWPDPPGSDGTADTWDDDLADDTHAELDPTPGVEPHPAPPVDPAPPRAPDPVDSDPSDSDPAGAEPANPSAEPMRGDSSTNRRSEPRVQGCGRRAGDGRAGAGRDGDPRTDEEPPPN